MLKTFLQSSTPDVNDDQQASAELEGNSVTIGLTQTLLTAEVVMAYQDPPSRFDYFSVQDRVNLRKHDSVYLWL